MVAPYDFLHRRINKVGDYNVFQPKCVVDRSVKVASGCFIGERWRRL